MSILYSTKRGCWLLHVKGSHPQNSSFKTSKENFSNNDDCLIFEDVSAHNSNNESEAMYKISEDQLRQSANLTISQTIAVMNFYQDRFSDISPIPNAPSRGYLSTILKLFKQMKYCILTWSNSPSYMVKSAK